MNLYYTEYPDSVRVVNAFDELFTTNFSQTQNGIVYPRELPVAGFEEIAAHIMDVFQKRHSHITQVSTSITQSPTIHNASWQEIKGLLTDQNDLAEALAIIDRDMEEFKWHGMHVDLRFERGHMGRANEPHYDGSGSNKVLRALTCYTLPDTKAWAKDDVEVSRSDLALKFAENATSFGMGVGPIWRMAVMGDMVQDDIDPFIHMRESSDEARMILVASKN